MTITDINSKAGPFSKYLFFIVLAFLQYVIWNYIFATQFVIHDGQLKTILSVGFSLLISPILSAGLFGGIHQQQLDEEITSVNAFFKGVKYHYWRILQAQGLYYLFLFMIGIPIVLAFSKDSAGPTLLGINLIYLIKVPFSALFLFWTSAIIVERKIFIGLVSAVKLLLFNPVALFAALACGVLYLADDILGDSLLIKQGAFIITILPAIVFSIAKIPLIALSLAVYRLANGEGYVAPVEQETAPVKSGNGLTNAAFGFACVAFLPLVHLAALVLGIMAIRRKKRFVMRAALACLAGGFFTIFYILVAAGMITSRVYPADKPDYRFLSDANASLIPQVALLEQAKYQQVRQQLEQDTVSGPGREWTVDTALGLAAFNQGTSDGKKSAREYFYSAAAKNPDKAEFYYYYGLVLVDGDQLAKAREEFATALSMDPTLVAAKNYIALLTAPYSSPPIFTALSLFIILIIAFALHEYGHAYSAWKLGDDTAKNLGRLTLNPIAHLDLFGSILLPGIMLAQQTGMVFGWAKPVPVDVRNFRNPRRDHMIVSFAGPAVNFLIAMTGFILLGVLMLVVRLIWPETISLNLASFSRDVSIVGPPFAKALVIIVIFIKQAIFTNLILGCLNLLPFPPLDGSWILAGLLPEQMGVFFEKVRAFGSIILLLLVVTSVLDYILVVPMLAAGWSLEILFGAMGL